MAIIILFVFIFAGISCLCFALRLALCRWFSYRFKFKPEIRAFSFAALHSVFRVVQGEYALDYGKSEAGSHNGTLVVGRRSVILVPNVAYLILRNADTVIYTVEGHFFTAPGQLDVYKLAVAGVLDSVVDEVAHNLHEPCPVTDHIGRLARMEADIVSLR